MINVGNPYDKPNGFDFYADILRRPHESIKIHYKLIYEERLKREKLEEYSRKMQHIENSNLLEKNMLIERLENYKAKLREIRTQKRVSLVNFVSNADQSNRPLPIKALHNRFKRTLIKNQSTNATKDDLADKQTEVLLEKQRTFLTSLDDLETTTIEIIKPKSALRRDSSEKAKKQTVKFKLEDISSSSSTSKMYIRKNQTNSAMPRVNLNVVAKSKPWLKSKSEENIENMSIGKLKLRRLSEAQKKPAYELPYELGEVVFPILVKSSTVM